MQLEGKELLLAMADPGNAAENPGWPLRNLLLLAAVRWRLKKATVVGFRSRGGRLSAEHSLLFDVNLPSIPAGSSIASLQNLFRFGQVHIMHAKP